jgi:hypothetical protein
MAAKLVADRAVPGLSIAVVYEDQIVYLEGFGLREMGKPETVDADTGLPDRLAVEAGLLDGHREAGQRRHRLLGFEDRRPRSGLPARRSLSDGRAHHPRPVQPPQRPSRHCRRRPRGDRLRPCRDSWRLRFVKPVVELPRRLFLFEFRHD